MKEVKFGRQITNPEGWLQTAGGSPGRWVTSGSSDMDPVTGVPTTDKATARNQRQMTFRNLGKLLPADICQLGGL